MRGASLITRTVGDRVTGSDRQTIGELIENRGASAQ